MLKICGYWIVPVKMFPYMRKAHKLARAMSEDTLDDILAGRKHLHKNPRKVRKHENNPDS